jgi:uncharacterized membrane-anchored protein
VTDDELKRLFEAQTQEAAKAHADTRRHFEVVAERLETRFDGLAESIQILDEKVDRQTASIRDEMRRGLATLRP